MRIVNWTYGFIMRVVELFAHELGHPFFLRITAHEAGDYEGHDDGLDRRVGGSGELGIGLVWFVLLWGVGGWVGGKWCLVCHMGGRAWHVASARAEYYFAG